MGHRLVEEPANQFVEPMGQLVKALGAAEGTLLAEVAVTHYPDLQIGTVPYLIFPSYANPTKTSWGYAFEFDLSYPRVWGSAGLGAAATEAMRRDAVRVDGRRGEGQRDTEEEEEQEYE